MKLFLPAFFLLPALFTKAQTNLIPAKNVVHAKWLKNQQYQMTWYAIKDTAKFEVGKVTTQVRNEKGKITVVTQVNMQKAKSPWVDTTIADATDLKPLYHSSYNGQRDMVLNFGKVVTGFYTDKINKSTVEIKDTTNAWYFDSNIYPALITWLSLQENYKQTISIYDYNPKGKTGVLKAWVKDVKKGIFERVKSGAHQVWVVSVADEIAGADAVSVYYIDVKDRRLWKQELNGGGRKMTMEFVED